MRIIFLLLTLSLVLLPLTVSTQETYTPWQATIHALGQDLGGLYKCDVVIGVDEASETPSPPEPPKYSVYMTISSADWESVYKDIRPMGESSYMWIIGIDPHGNIPPPVPRISTISWDPSEFGPGNYELREGYDGVGEVVVSDMKTTASYSVEGGSAAQYFTVVLSP